MKREKSCGVIIYLNKPDTRYLVVKSKTNGHWGYPKGHIEKNESEIDAAIREVKEETGLEVLIHEDFITRIEYMISENEIIKEVILFLGTPMSSPVTIQKNEIAMYKWATLTDTLNLLEYENQKQSLKKAHEYINKGLY